MEKAEGSSNEKNSWRKETEEKVKTHFSVLNCVRIDIKITVSHQFNIVKTRIGWLYY
jgi:hypothetical protein